MKAARFYKPGEDLHVEEVETPKAGPGEAVVRVRAAGVCGTELHFLDGLLPAGKTPLVLGHEVAGEVVEINGAESDFDVGDRVVLYYYSPCHVCYNCRRAAENLCDDLKGQLGFLSDGGYAQFVRIAVDSLVRLPEHLSFEEAAPLCCAATTAIHAVRNIAQVRFGETVVVYGAGGVGLMLVQIARLAGARVAAISRNPARRSKAAELGAEVTIDPESDDVVSRVRDFTNDRGADAVFELAGVTKTMNDSVEMLAKRGRLVFIGYSTDNLEVSPIRLVIGEVNVTASVGNTKEELIEAVRLAADGRIRSVVHEVLPLAEVNRALEMVRRGEVVGRLVLAPE